MDGGRNYPKRYTAIPSGGSSSCIVFIGVNYLYEDVMKAIYAVLFGCFVVSGAKVCNAQVTNWENSPYNFKNSELNYDNSSMKWENSPYNWKNSEYNYYSNTGVYDNSGNRIGYETISPSGTRNYYDNDGNRKAYGR